MSEYKLVYPYKKKPEKGVEFICGERLDQMVGDVMGTRVEGSQIPKLIRIDTFETIWGKIIVSPNKQDVRSEDIVWLQDEKDGTVEESHWYIKVIEEFEEEEIEVKVLPEMKIALGKRKGGMLAAMLGGEHKKDK